MYVFFVFFFYVIFVVLCRQKVRSVGSRDRSVDYLTLNISNVRLFGICNVFFWKLHKIYLQYIHAISNNDHFRYVHSQQLIRLLVINLGKLFNSICRSVWDFIFCINSLFIF